MTMAGRQPQILMALRAQVSVERRWAGKENRLSSARTPSWPLMRSEYLTRVREAFRARSKSLRHRVLAWSCERGEQDGHESIEFTFDHSGPLVRLKVWEDSAVWFCAWAMKAGRDHFLRCSWG